VALSISGHAGIAIQVREVFPDCFRPKDEGKVAGFDAVTGVEVEVGVLPQLR
jgi:hypothetical protein